MKKAVCNNIKPVISYNLSIREKIIDLCKPIFDNFDVTYFEYARILNDGRVFYICTNNSWLNFSLEHKMFDDEEHVYLCSLARNHNHRYALWNFLQLENTSFLSKYYDFDIWNGLTINEFEEDSFVAYSFATTKNNLQLSDFFINNLKLFDRFIIYFKQKLQLIVEDNLNNVLIEGTPLTAPAKNTNINKYNQNIKNFLQQTELEKFEFNIKDKSIKLTKRELQCIHMTSHGKTMKEIASHLSLSQRTVESYLNAAKAKSGLFYKTDIISFFKDSPLKHYGVE